MECVNQYFQQWTLLFFSWSSKKTGTSRENKNSECVVVIRIECRSEKTLTVLDALSKERGRSSEGKAKRERELHDQPDEAREGGKDGGRNEGKLQKE